MQYVVVIEVPEELLDGDDSIENACRVLNQDCEDAHTVIFTSQEYAGATEYLDSRILPHITARPLSEIIAA